MEGSPLDNLEHVRPLYMLPTDPLAEEVHIPAFKIATRVDCMVGFFSSSVLASLAPGLATYINHQQNSFRLLISPLLSEEDLSAVERGARALETIAEEALDRLIVTEDLIQRHTLECLSWMLAKGRLEMKLALMSDALFHPKVWLYHFGSDIMAVHGSSNVTLAGIRKNVEQIAVSGSWRDANQRYIAKKFQESFEQLWGDKDDDCIVIDLPTAVKKRLIKTYSRETAPMEDEFLRLKESLNRPKRPPEGAAVIDRPVFEIPSSIQYEAGPYEHQGKAVAAWCEAQHRGILEMATGSGKTITAMICARKLYETRRPLLIVVAAPYVPLIQQWHEEVQSFGLEPVNITLAAGARGRAKELGQLRRRMANGGSDVEVVIVSHDTLCNAEFHQELAKFEATSMIIADEVHNLGRTGFLSQPPDFFDYRLGLSATPVRQYDEEGTAALIDYFGRIVFTYSLREAIGNCLVEYDYYVHPVELTTNEMDEWYELTEKIKALAWKDTDEDDSYLSKLLRDRRYLLEAATNKIPALDKYLSGLNLKALRHTLIYATDKGPDQLNDVNSLLMDKGVLFHQLTARETADRQTVKKVLQSFKDGEICVLTAKRVLDEGVNIPEIQKAFILASTTVERQWVQRRGRLLRTCPEINKTHSEIHDFLVVPPRTKGLDAEARKLIRAELSRTQEFASIARNAGRPGGPLEVIDRLIDDAFS